MITILNDTNVAYIICGFIWGIIFSILVNLTEELIDYIKSKNKK